MKLKDLIKNVKVVETRGPTDVEVKGITDDSRKVKKGYLFVAIRGLTVDGKDYIQEAIKKGAVAIVYKEELGKKTRSFLGDRALSDIALVEVKNDRRALSIIASNWYNNPSRKLKMIGVTGTDGKTTTCNFIHSILKESDKKVGLITTVSAKIGKKEVPTGFHVTNPEPMPLQEFLNEMVKKGMEYCILEVTSHGLDQERIAGIDFEVSLITNVTDEHLDYHKTYKEYLSVKAKIFPISKKVFLNKDSEGFSQLKRIVPKDSLIYSKDDYDFTEVLSKSFPGDYNQQNAAGAAKLCESLGISKSDIIKGLKALEKIEGRFENIDRGQDFQIVIDFAHTPNALKNVLMAARNKSEGRVISVFGSAGLRDKDKRPVMGEISQKHADLVVLTAEDPRTEDVDRIIDNISKGNTKAGGEINKTFFKVSDRQEAINFAIRKLAKKGDMVIITGKGHEKSMCFGTTEHPWSDYEAVDTSLKR